jgi:endo-1,3(4)-beta-glucanase
MPRSPMPNDGDTAPNAPWGDKVRNGIWNLSDIVDSILARLTAIEAKLNSVTTNPPTTAPVAAFAATPTTGTFPLSVNFTDQSTGLPTSWLWSFGDGTTSAAPNPTHVYAAAGTYTPTLVATNSAGSSVNKQSPTGSTVIITVTGTPSAAAPTASFTGSPTSGSAPLSVFFTDTSTNTPTSWAWNFGDGTTSTAQNPAHTYAAGGPYSVSLTVSNSAGTSAVFTRSSYVTASTAAAPTTGIRAAISTAAPSYTTAASSFPTNMNRHTLTGAIPTNAWFENFMVESGHQPVQLFPYMVKTTVKGMDFCVPPLYTGFPNSVLSTMLATWSFQSAEALNADTAGRLTGFTDLGCTLTWAGTSTGSMTADIVRGMGYVTMRYNGLKPLIITQNAITSINGAAVGDASTFTGTKFKFALNNGQTWLMYTSSSVTFTMSVSSNLTASAAFTGTIRLALLPAGGSEAAVDASAPSIPTGGTVSLSVAANTATETFDYTSTGSGTPLIYALPHHQARMTPTYPAGLTINTLRGQMKGVTGASWTLQLPLPTVSWNNKNPVASTRLAAVQAALDADENFTPTMNDPYFGGKQVAKAARLALIADQIGDTTARDKLVAALRTTMNAYLGGTAVTKLRYDTVWGGVVSVAGLTDSGADFGNGRYNDHHFHYGYTIYAAAVLAKLDTAWATTSNKTKIQDLIRDIANPSSSDPYFTPMRHWDWFEGHSWAAGTFEFGDNRNSESTSEGVNAYYGIHLWGVVTANTQLTNLGRILMAEEISSAQTYWQVKQAQTLYPDPFKKNGVIGIVWSNKVDYATWFSADAACIHGIQMIPTNPTTEVLVEKSWIAETWPNNLLPLWTRSSVWEAELVTAGTGYVPAQNSGAPAFQGFTNGLTATGGSGTGLVFNVNITPSGAIDSVYIVFDRRGTGYVDAEIVQLNGSGGTGATVKVHTSPADGWKGILLGGYAANNPTDAWSRATALTAYDDGSSKTQLLYHIATQTGA